MIEGDRFFYDEFGRHLYNEYVDGRVRIYDYKNGGRTTEIEFEKTTIMIAREKVPLSIPSDYGRIIIPTSENIEVLPIKKPVLSLPFLVVEDNSGILGKAEGNRFDLALAYSLGLSDPELVIDKKDTTIDLKISDRIAEIIF